MRSYRLNANEAVNTGHSLAIFSSCFLIKKSVDKHLDLTLAPLELPFYANQAVSIVRQDIGNAFLLMLLRNISETQGKWT